MCGIFGFNWSDKALLQKMNKVLVHRGPDDAAFYEDKNISLGMRRLAIIDLKKGLYPISNEDGTLLTIFNGELYNFKEVREQLEPKHKFITDCDAEIIPHAYEEWGLDFVKKVSGMFAICLYDLKNKELILIRDRVGIKPLYYWEDENKLAFASEIKSLLQLPRFKKKVNKTALNEYLTHRYIPGEDTLFMGIKRLLPGHILIQGKEQQIIKYWDVHFSKSKNTLSQNAAYLKELLEDSVKSHLMSDVPLGAYLSGGLDSSAIVAMMSKHSDNVNTFNVSFPDTEFDESKYAQLVADRFNTNHKQIDVKIDAIEVLPKVAWHLDEPIADAATIPTYLMSQETRKHVKVVLSGEGSDELFGGYERFRHLSTANKFRYLPFKKSFSNIKTSNETLNRAFGLFSNLDDEKSAYLSYYSVFSREDRKNLLNVEPDESKIEFGNNLVEEMQRIDIKERLPNNMLLKNDKMTMAHSIEARVPFLDHRLVEFSTKIPDSQKFSLLKDKIVYRQAIKKVIPNEI